MHLKQFSEEFIQKWLNEDDNKKYISLKDKKMKAGINWISAINQKSFTNLDKMYEELNKKCKECLEKNCREDYIFITKELIIDNNNLTKIEKEEKLKNLQILGYENLQIKNPEKRKEIENKIISFHNKKKQCYEKINLFRAIMIRLSNNWNDELNVCINICKNKPLDRNTELPDCYSTCIIQKSYEVVSNEYYMKYVYDKLLEEYNQNKIEMGKIDLLHSYRFKKREINDENKFKYV
jgi:hypothetical protein